MNPTKWCGIHIKVVQERKQTKKSLLTLLMLKTFSTSHGCVLIMILTPVIIQNIETFVFNKSWAFGWLRIVL